MASNLEAPSQQPLPPREGLGGRGWAIVVLFNTLESWGSGSGFEMKEKWGGLLGSRSLSQSLESRARLAGGPSVQAPSLPSVP